jgi:hypothetical protein
LRKRRLGTSDRPLVFGLRLLRGLLPRSIGSLDGSWLAIVTAICAVALGQAAESSDGARFSLAGRIRLGGLGLALLVAAYREWDVWAPCQAPLLKIEEWAGDNMRSLVITNDDVPARFRVEITAITEPGGRPRPRPDEPYPWALAWGDAAQAECHLVRGEQAHIPLVEFDEQAAAQLYYGHVRQNGNVFPFLFHGPSPHGLFAFMSQAKPENDIEVHVRIVRIDPEPGYVDYKATVTFPPCPTDSNGDPVLRSISPGTTRKHSSAPRSPPPKQVSPMTLLVRQAAPAAREPHPRGTFTP